MDGAWWLVRKLLPFVDNDRRWFLTLRSCTRIFSSGFTTIVLVKRPDVIHFSCIFTSSRSVSCFWNASASADLSRWPQWWLVTRKVDTTLGVLPWSRVQTPGCRHARQFRAALGLPWHLYIDHRTFLVGQRNLHISKLVDLTAAAVLSSALVLEWHLRLAEVRFAKVSEVCMQQLLGSTWLVPGQAVFGSGCWPLWSSGSCLLWANFGRSSGTLVAS